MLNVLGDCSCSSQSLSLYPLCYYTLLAPKSLKRQTLPFVSLFNSDRGVWYQQGLSIFFFSFQTGEMSLKGKTLKRDSCCLYFVTALTIIIFPEVFLIIMHKQNCQGRIWAILSELQMKVMGFLKTLFTLLNTGRTERARQTCSHIKRTACLPLQY